MRETIRDLDAELQKDDVPLFHLEGLTRRCFVGGKRISIFIDVAFITSTTTSVDWSSR